MTDRDALLIYRMDQAKETLAEAEKMLAEGFSPRSITNRAYYAMFYALLVLFIKAGVPLTTSKHSGVINDYKRPPPPPQAEGRKTDLSVLRLSGQAGQ